MRISDWSSDVCSSYLNGIASRSTISAQDVKELRGTLRWEHTADTWINDLKITYEDVKWAPTPVEFGNGYLFAYAGPDPDDPPPGAVVRGDILRIGGGSKDRKSTRLNSRHISAPRMPSPV